MTTFGAARKPFLAPVSDAECEISDCRHQTRLGEIDEAHSEPIASILSCRRHLRLPVNLGAAQPRREGWTQHMTRGHPSRRAQWRAPQDKARLISSESGPQSPSDIQHPPIGI